MGFAASSIWQIDSKKTLKPVYALLATALTLFVILSQILPSFRLYFADRAFMIFILLVILFIFESLLSKAKKIFVNLMAKSQKVRRVKLLWG
jgi:hypothetical protein